MHVNLIWQIAFAFACINAGLFLMGTWIMEPAVEELEPTPHLTIRKLLIKRLNKIAPALMNAALVSSLVTAVNLQSGLQKWLMASAAGLFLCMFLITLLGNVPQNKRFLVWNPNAYPDDWKLHVAKWAFFDKLRFGLSMGTLILEFTALIT